MAATNVKALFVTLGARIRITIYHSRLRVYNCIVPSHADAFVIHLLQFTYSLPCNIPRASNTHRPPPGARTSGLSRAESGTGAPPPQPAPVPTLKILAVVLFAPARRSPSSSPYPALPLTLRSAPCQSGSTVIASPRHVKDHRISTMYALFPPRHQLAIFTPPSPPLWLTPVFVDLCVLRPRCHPCRPVTAVFSCTFHLGAGHAGFFDDLPLCRSCQGICENLYRALPSRAYASAGGRDCVLPPLWKYQKPRNREAATNF